jgi:hypothetical protein
MKLALSLTVLAEFALADFHPVSLGPRPYWLIDQMRDGLLKDTLGEFVET